MKKIKTLFLAIVSLMFIFNTTTAYAAPLTGSKSEVCQGAGVDCSNPEEKVSGVLQTALNLFRLIIGVIAVFFIVYAGLRFITSGGDAGKVASARNTIIYASIGLVVVIIAPIIINFVLNRV